MSSISNVHKWQTKNLHLPKDYFATLQQLFSNKSAEYVPPILFLNNSAVISFSCNIYFLKKKTFVDQRICLPNSLWAEFCSHINQNPYQECSWLEKKVTAVKLQHLFISFKWGFFVTRPIWFLFTFLNSWRHLYS